MTVGAVIVALLLGSAGFLAAQGAPLPCGAPPVGTDRVAAIDSVLEVASRDSTRDLRGVVVLRCGGILAERYYNGADSSTLHDIRSATKSITSTLVGIAIQQGRIPGVDTPIGRLLPGGMPEAQQGIRLSDLLTMRSGLDADDQDPRSPGNEANMDTSTDWLALAYRVPVVNPPGQRYSYNSLTAFLAGRIVEEATHLPLAEYAQRNLFGPLHIAHYAWRRGPRGEGVGQGNLSITARDMAAIGELFRCWGRFEGRQVVDSAWIAAAWAERVPINEVDRYADSYGYMWYNRRHSVAGRTVQVHFASGNGGNKIYVIPAESLVVAITSSAYNRGYGQRRSEALLLGILEATGL